MDDAPAKPSPEPLQLALRGLGGVAPGPHVAMIGDTVDDIRAARAAGCVGLGVVAPQFWKSPESVAKEEEILRVCVCVCVRARVGVRYSSVLYAASTV
jgi:phosphoglycolate phosphatase-like HAD superfamily hydrolase